MEKSVHVLTQWLQEWRQASFRLLWLALFIAVFTVASITAFTSRLSVVFDDGAARFLGGDIAVESSRELPSDWLTLADTQGLSRTLMLDFASMLQGPERMQLVSVKAVDAGYPLKGQLEVSESPAAPVEVVQEGPTPGQVWLAPRLLSLLQVSVGDQVRLGNRSFLVAKVLRKEPDPSFNFANVAPRVVMAMADVASTGVVQPGSRLQYRLLLAGEGRAISQYQRQLEPELRVSDKIMLARESGRAVGGAIARAERYLLLGGVLGVLLAAVALTITAQFYAQQQKDTVALLKTLGYQGRDLRRRFASLLGLSAVTASVAGLLAGRLAEGWVAHALREMLPPLQQSLPLTWMWLPVVSLIIVLLAFAWPVFLGLAKEPPMLILRQTAAHAEMQKLLGFSFRRLLVAACGFAALLYLYSREPVIVFSVLLGLGLLIFIASALMGVWVKLRPPRHTLVPGRFKTGLEQLKRRPWSTVPHILALASAWSLLLTLLLVRTELVDNWQAQVPADAPNHFLINIAPYEVRQVETLLDEAGIPSAPLYPMVRGRLTSINGEPVTSIVSKERVGALNRELNLTWMEALPEDNRILEGRWWDEVPATDLPGVSVESELAARLDLEVGDSLGFNIGEQLLDARITSIRSVQWDSLKPNFYMAFQPGALQNFAATYLTSAYISPDEVEVVNRLNRQFPTVSVLELDQFVRKIREVIEQVTSAMEALLLMIFAAALLVVAALLAREVPVRKSEAALYRALGAERSTVNHAIFGEFAWIGGIAAALGLLIAELTAAVIQYRMFEMSFSPHPWLWLTVPAASAVLTAFYAQWRLRQVLSVPPHHTLQNGLIE